MALFPPNKLPKAAQDWLTVAIDPYHDTAVNLEGMPDSTLSRSYVRVHNQTWDVACTADSDNISVNFFGFHGAPTSMNQVTSNRNIAGTSFNLSPMTIIRSPTGVDPSVYNTAVGTATVVGGGGTTLDGTKPSRLIAMAIEIHDVTPQLYKKGTISAAHLSGTVDHVETVRYIGTDVSIERCDEEAMRPSSLSQLQAYPTMLTGEASKGCYMIARLQHPRKPARFEGTANYGHSWSLVEIGSAGTQTRFYKGGATWDDYLSRGVVHSGFQPMYIRLSGLPDVGQYRITMRCIVEYFPEPSDLVDLSISTLSPAYCSKAFELYHEVVSRMPTYVPVGNNASGDFWRMALRVLKFVAPPIVSAVPLALTAAGQPELGAIARVVGNALNAKLQTVNIKPGKVYPVSANTVRSVSLKNRKKKNRKN